MASAKKKKFGFKKIVGWLHLVLGMGSGLVIVFLGITGCVLAFEHEIRNISQPSLATELQSAPILPPSVLKANAEKQLDGHTANGIEYPGEGRSAIVSYYDADHYYTVMLDPYSGAVKEKRNMNRDFFRVVLDGHFYLWLPPAIGQPIVASATLIFLVMLITGIILWWPRNKAAAKQRFSVKWSAKWRRRNYDLHNVLGFYMSWIGIILAITGLVWGFQWFADSFYWVTNGAKGPSEQVFASSDTLQANNGRSGMMDSIWASEIRKIEKDESLSVYFPAGNAATIEVSVNHRPGTYYNSDAGSFDQYTGQRLVSKGTYAGKFSEAGIADKIKRMNYDIHVGAVLGLPGKILMFCASLVAASLPITGFYIWWGRRKKKPAAKKIVPAPVN